MRQWRARVFDRLEHWLEAEREQLFLWLPVMLGGGISLWFVLPDRQAWAGALFVAGALAAGALAMDRGARASRVTAMAALAVAGGLAMIWSKAESVAAPVLGRPAIVRFEARVERIEPLPARDLYRLRLAPLRLLDQGDARRPAALPPHIRVNLTAADMPAGLGRQAVIRLGARLMPPPGPSVPGAYDFARVAWFGAIGATGRGFGPVEVIAPGMRDSGGLRTRLAAHIQRHLPGGAGGIATALATGDQGAIPIDDAEAMRRAGLAHLLSVSGLHITAVVGGVMVLLLRLLALSPWLALHLPLRLIAAGAAAVAAIGYTLLTGAEVPTVRSCVAALLVLVALAIGREAVTLRLVATGAVIVLLFWPEALVGPSFQLSFAAVAAIIALHEQPRVKAWFAAREEGRGRAVLRGLASLLLTGILVEAALSPIALFHFHKAGLYGAIANIVAIPLTTFVVMPIEGLALVLDPIGLAWPFWWLLERSLMLLLWIAHRVGEAPGAVATLPTMGGGAFGLIVLGGLWLGLWRTRWRALGLLPLTTGAIMAARVASPDLLVTGDGRHIGVRAADGGIAMLRDRAGDYTRAMLAENGGVDGEPSLLADQRNARCSADLCLVDRVAAGRRWRILATRSAYRMPAAELIAACRGADIVISERWLPRRCVPRWLKLDRPVLARTGGVAITLATGTVTTVARPGDAHPWRAPPLIEVNRSGGAIRRASPGRVPGADHNAGDHKRGWPDRAGSSPPRGGNI